MDAPELKPVTSRRQRPRFTRLVIAWLAILLASGLWQAYGEWLFSSAASHVL